MNNIAAKGNFVHLVYFWLKEPENQACREQFLTNINLFLQNCEEQISSMVGTPAMTPRPVVDNSYTFSLLVVLESTEQHDKYQKHPAHLKFIETTSALWSKVQIYDSINL